MMMTRIFAATLAAAAWGVFAADDPPRRIWLDELDLSQMTSGWDSPKKNLSIAGKPLTVNGKAFARGVGTHALSSGTFLLSGGVTRFEADVGIDGGMASDAGPAAADLASVKFLVYLDDGEKPAAESPVLRRGDGPYHLSADLAGAKRIELFVCDARDGTNWDHADWANAFFTAMPGATVVPDGGEGEQLGILTPRPGPAPRINGLRVYGVRPGHPVIYRLPVTGDTPFELAAANLPDGLSFDVAKGIVTGAVAARGEYPVVFTAKNAAGAATATVKFVVGDRIALTPPMGWNSWNCFAHTVTAEKIRDAADVMDASELAKHGYSYVNIDDFWQNRPGEKDDETLIGPERHVDGTIAVNRRFPSMKAVADDIHAKGFRAGLYSSPGATTCGGCTGSWGHEWTDARTYAAWGYDYLKYDWCGYDKIVHAYGADAIAQMTLPYFLMGEALQAQDRDIVFSICQYGMHNVSTWGARAGGTCWRTTNDILDSWRTAGTDAYGACYRGLTDIIEHEEALWPYAGPGAWNDADMLQLGTVGFGDPHPTHLTPNEQYTHMSFWCILCSPLLIGCDLTRLDEFTLNLLCNDEVLETNQDPLGAQAAKVAICRGGEVWAKPMCDGSVVFALLNTDRRSRALTADFASLGMEGEWKVRDLWRQADWGLSTKGITVRVPSHATALYRAWPQAGAGMRKGFGDIRMNWVYGAFARGRPVDKPGYVSPASAAAPCANCPESKRSR